MREARWSYCDVRTDAERSDPISEEVMEKAMNIWHSTLEDERKKHGMSLLISRAILAERDRIAEIISAEREWGGDIREVADKVYSGEGPRLISGWNAEYDENNEDVLIPYPATYVKPANGG